MKATLPARSPNRAGFGWLSKLVYLPLFLAGLLMLALLTLPLILSLLVSFTATGSLEVPNLNSLSLRWFEAFFKDAIWQKGALNSFLIAALSTLISTFTGTTAALAFERHEFRFKRTLGFVVLMPLFVPPVVLGIQSLAWYQRIGLWGSLLSLALAHSLWGTPIVFMVMRAALRQVDPRLEEAALGLGASPRRVFWWITLPLILPGMLVGAFFAFIISLNDFVMSLFLVTPKTQTISTIIWPQLQYNPTPLVAAASAILLGLTILLLGLAVRILGIKKLL